MVKVNTEKVPIEGRKAVRDMRNKAILSRDTTARNAYLRRRNLRRRRVQEVQQLRVEADRQSVEIAELKEQLAHLSKLVKKTTTRKKKAKGS